MDDDADDDVEGGGPPLPPEDRLWRHPSELREFGSPTGIALHQPRTRSRRRETWAIAAVAGLTGVVLTTGALAVTGVLSPQVIRREIVEKVAVTPVLSSPLLAGERDASALAERLAPAIVRLDITQGANATTGSGVVFRNDGLVLTAAHLVTAATLITAVLTDGRRLDGVLVGVDPLTDVALVDLDGQGLPVAVLGTGTNLKVGAPTMAIGAALTGGADPSVTTGVISALDRRVDGAGGQPLHGMIQTSAPVAPGSAGGVLVDASGAVIGLLSSSTDEPTRALAVATPIDLVRRVADHLLATGRMAHGWLGVEGSDLSSDEATTLSVPGGAKVRRVDARSPAALAGLAPDDVITEVDGAPVRSISVLVARLRSHDPGDKVRLGYWRHGQHAEVTVTLDQRP